MDKFNIKGRYFQQGAVLLTSLVIVFIIAILGTAIGHQVLLQRKMSTSHYDQTLSFINANSALAEGEAVISENAYSGTNRLSLDAEDSVAVAKFTKATWWTDKDNWVSAVGLKNNNTPITGNPAYIIEDLGLVPTPSMDNHQQKRHFYRVTAKAQGKGEASSFVQSHYVVME